jgi:lipid A disaccharide synthetase
VRILISAGDLSGEIYGAEILKGLKNSFPTDEFFSLTNGLISKA